MSAKENFKVCQDLIVKYLKPEKIVWPREIKLAKTLLSENSAGFFNSLELKFKLNSLAFFKTEEGMAYLLQHRNDLEKSTREEKTFQVLTSPDKPVILEKDKVGEDVRVSKSKTMMEFLDLDF